MTADAREPHRDEGADLLQALDAADKKEPAQHAKETSRPPNLARTGTPIAITPRPPALNVSPRHSYAARWSVSPHARVTHNEGGCAMKDNEILGQIGELIDEEHTLRRRLAAGELNSEEEHTRIRDLEESLDRCWDLLRQRRARRGAGEDPDDAAARPVGEVENYLQ
ncbi:hypothetical protein GCM10023194_16240 [Planotetraspora phitsanulokensis]|uniref:DUF2630 family protein n=2 Tax=Planotetraspora phitsanulokensis TaxID=575192 RepID=A0A8J3XFB4_9ACTN|nr:hypothetical protein Pph01_37670 [Planotetraspora phitsanulokensis]